MFFAPFHVLVEREALVCTGSNLSGDRALRSKCARVFSSKTLQSQYNLKDQTVQQGFSPV